ncbi:hypothetical protein CLIB1423_02S11848 [[Candida] railenensis]|uniref:PQ loop repeat protein n=1 Tax=[Candida] railenensis TaxID=45579 RepID=A0A9P0QLZ4_9ASCO|nr:hypothetical protein CLIB1423_02S11848 [[Candida] railenensis]
MIKEPEDFCSVYEGASVGNFIFSVLITIGIVGSYIPQYLRINLKRTSEGLSTNFLLLGSCSSLFTFTNIMLVSSRARGCCYAGQLALFNCINSQLNLVQIGLQCFCAILILVLVLLLTRYSIKQDREEYLRIERVGYWVLLHFAISVLQILIGVYSKDRGLLISIANVNGLLSTILTMVKYVPQIYTTYVLKHPGTLSIGMMCIQTPGGALFTLTLFLTKGSHWSSWISYFTAFILQGCLLTLCIYYEYFRDHGLAAEFAERREVERIVEENEREDSPLVGASERE